MANTKTTHAIGKKQKPRRTERFTFLLSPAERAEIANLAARQERSESATVRLAVLSVARELLQKGSSNGQ